MKLDEIYSIIDKEPLDLPFKKALLSLVLEVEKLQPEENDEGTTCFCGKPAIVKTFHKSGNVTFECEKHDVYNNAERDYY
jgi:hypothetical protein